MLGVPLLTAERPLGVLHVGRLENRPFTDHDVALLQVVADRVVGAIQGQALAVERAAAVLLERSLLPDQLPSQPGLELAARYVPAQGEAVGGDWYDVFTLPSGELWIVVGDVAGHGIQASIVMGRIRSALPRLHAARASPGRGLAPRRPQGRPLRDRHHRHGRLRRHRSALRHLDRRPGRASTASDRNSESTCRGRSRIPVRRSAPGGVTNPARPPSPSPPAPQSPSTPMAWSNAVANRSTSASNVSGPRSHPLTREVTADSHAPTRRHRHLIDDIALVVLRKTAT